jgi:hypothetical protein
VRMTQDVSPGRTRTTYECNWRSSKPNPILSETTDYTQSTDYLYTKPDLLVNLDSTAHLRTQCYSISCTLTMKYWKLSPLLSNNW